MCTELRKDVAVPIRETGFGYKVFHTRMKRLGKPIVGTCFSRGGEPHALYKKNRGGWIVFDKKLDPYEGDGFCFFRDKKSAESMRKRRFPSSKKKITLKIEYRGGLGKQPERCGTDKLYPMCLCKEFRIVEG